MPGVPRAPGEDGRRGGLSGRGFPTGRAYAWLAVTVMIFAAYASLIPFRLTAVPLDDALAEFSAIMTRPPSGRIPRTNFLANILLFVPLGYGLMGALTVDRRRLTAIPAILLVLPVSLAVSLTVEFLQIFAPGRVTSLSDVIAQTIGCVIGIAIWIAAGQGLTNWLRVTFGRSGADRLARVLAAYAAVWLFVNLAPFDIVLDPGELAHRARVGQITLVPFGTADVPVWRILWDALATALSAAPLGVLGLVGSTGDRARRSAGAAFGFGAALVVAVEVSHIFIRSHAADTGDVLFGCLGVALGVWVGGRLLSQDRILAQPAPSAVSGWALAALGAWVLVLCAYHWMPYDFAVDSAAISRKLARVSLIPFAGYRSGSDLNALNNVLVKLSLSVPLGVIAAFVVRGSVQLPAALTGAWLALAVAVFGGIEAGQLLLPARVPDPTDVLVGVAGTAAGLWLGRWLQAGLTAGAASSPPSRGGRGGTADMPARSNIRR